MTRKGERLHPALHLNRLLASPIFIVAINAAFLAMLLSNMPSEKFDITMSWTTMIMDQVMILVSWVVLVKTIKHTKQLMAQLRRIEDKINLMGRIILEEEE